MFQTAVTLFSFQTNPILLLISVFLTMPPPFSQLLKLLFPFLLSISSHRGSTLSFSHPFQLFHPKLHSLVISFPTIGSHYFIRSMNHFQKRSNNISSLMRNPPFLVAFQAHKCSSLAFKIIQNIPGIYLSCSTYWCGLYTLTKLNTLIFFEQTWTLLSCCLCCFLTAKTGFYKSLLARVALSNRTFCENGNALQFCADQYDSQKHMWSRNPWHVASATKELNS